MRGTGEHTGQCLPATHPRPPALPHTGGCHLFLDWLDSQHHGRPSTNSHRGRRPRPRPPTPTPLQGVIGLCNPHTPQRVHNPLRLFPPATFPPARDPHARPPRRWYTTALLPALLDGSLHRTSFPPHPPSAAFLFFFLFFFFLLDSRCATESRAPPPPGGALVVCCRRRRRRRRFRRRPRPIAAATLSLPLVATYLPSSATGNTAFAFSPKIST